jgi:catechol 2,3-dioxygenase-like lactoylglutathione lyase family enzyme
MELYMVEVRVSDWATSSRWYVDVLGLRPSLEDRERRFLLLDAGSGRVALKEGPVIPDRGAVRLIFRVADVAAERDRLAGLGVEVSAISESSEGYREVRLADPDGTPIHLFSWAGTGPIVVADGGPAG